MPRRGWSDSTRRCPAARLANGGKGAGDHARWAGERCSRGGIAGVALHGALALDAIVAQGCRPIGVPLFVTAFQRALGGVALGGFFGNGELGPVDGRTYPHAYTSAFGLFRTLD